MLNIRNVESRNTLIPTRRANSPRALGLIVALLFLCLPTSLVWAQENEAKQTSNVKDNLPKPMNFAKAKYAEILKLNAMEASNKRNEAINAAFNAVIDYDDLAERTLNEYWTSLEDNQREEFAGMFKKLIALNIVDKVGSKKFANNYNMDWDGVTSAKDQRIVSCFIMQRDVETELEFVLYPKNNTWMLHDLLIDGASLHRTYSKKYEKHYIDKSYDTLRKEMLREIEKLEKKLKV